jgi:hypothetical protein
MHHTRRSLHPVAAALFAAGLGLAATGAHAQNVKPPKAQLWMDVSTGTMAGMPEIDMPAGVGGMLGGMMGGGASGGGRGGAPTAYGLARTPNIMPPRVLDIAFYNRLKPGAEASQAIPPGMRMGESLPLLPPKPEVRTQQEREPGEVPQEVRQPKGRILVYWGCGETVRPGQPRIIDFSRASPSEFGAVFAGRHVPDRGAKVGPQYVLYPNERNTVALARDSSLVGEHQVRGDGVPASMKFTLGEAQNVMPAIQLKSEGTLQDSMALSWQPVTNARAYYLHAMSQSGEDMVMWSSAETGDSGMGLFDYLPNGTIEQWKRDRVLLAADTTRCAIPKGIFAPPAGGRQDATPMLRMIAYGGESDFAYPPRPADPKAVWEPDWAVRVRLKSHAMAMLGRDMGEGRAARAPSRRGEPPPATSDATQTEQQQGGDKPGLPLPVNPGAILRGIFGR